MRLNKAIKEEIVRAAIVAAKIPDNREVNRARRAKWAENVRRDGLGGPDVATRVESAAKSIEKILSHLPEVAKSGNSPIVRGTFVTLNLAGKRVRAYFSGELGYTPSQTYKFTPSNHTLKNGPLCAEFDKIESIEDALDAIETDLTVKVWAILGSVTTVKKLLAVWPEASALLPEKRPSVDSNLPAVPTYELNKLLGLEA